MIHSWAIQRVANGHAWVYLTYIDDWIYHVLGIYLGKTNSMTKLWLDIIGLDGGRKSDDQMRYGRGRADVLL